MADYYGKDSETGTALGTLEVKNPPIDADKVIYRDSEASDALVTSTWTQVKAFLKTYWDTIYANKSLEDTYVRLLWFEEISSGTSGTITPPTGGTIVLDQWAAGIDAVTSTITSGNNPTYESAKEADGTIITVTLDASGNWSLSGTPSAYPIAILFVYDVKLINADRTKSLVEIETDQGLKKTDSPTFANITDSGLTASQTVFSDANKKLVTKSAADTMAALVGSLTANYKCFVNAAGNGTEWAAGFSIVSFTHDMATASGDKAITGAGFKPKAAILIAGIDASPAAFNIGMCVDTTEHSVQFINTATPSWNVANNYILDLHHDSSSNYTYTSVASMDSDGMTLTMVKVGTPTATIKGVILFLR